MAAHVVIRLTACILSNRIAMRQRRLILRQHDAKCTAAAVPGFERKPPAIHFHGPFGDGQAEPGSAIVPRSRFINPVKAVEDARLQFLWDTGPRIADLKNGIF